MADPTALIGKYATPRFKYGATVTCEIRGDVVICGLSNGRIQWPLGKRDGIRGFIIFGDLERAIRTESNAAVRYWWGVTMPTVTRWRKELGVERFTEGNRRLAREQMLIQGPRMRANIDHRAPERRAKIAASKLGKPRPKHVHQALRRANLGRSLLPEHCRKISERNRRLGIRPPVGELWTAAEDAAVRTLPPKLAAERTGRPLSCVYARRRTLGIAKPKYPQ